MSWRSKIAAVELSRIIAIHEQIWSEIETKGGVDSLEFQAEHDRLGYILVELWEEHAGSDELVALAIARFVQKRSSQTQKLATASDDHWSGATAVCGGGLDGPRW